jgi:hypothetical protein
MPQQRRFKRLGSTSAAVSLGALTLVVTGAGPAGAGTTKECAQGDDPVTALKTVPCRLETITGGITVKITGGTGGHGTEPQPAGDPPNPPEQATEPRPAPPRAPTSPKHTARDTTPFTVSGIPGIRMPRPDGAPVPAPASEADIARILPRPHVATPPPAVAQPVPADRLVTPMAATDRQDAHMMWVALAAGLAGAVGALNLSIAGSRLRRPKPRA